jgi:hypothetical protein
MLNKNTLIVNQAFDGDIQNIYKMESCTSW